MSHISRRYLVGLLLIPIVMGGGVATQNEGLPEVQAVQKYVAPPSLPRQIDPAELHGERPNTSPTQRSTILGRGERLGSNIRVLVTQMDPVMPINQVDLVVSELLDDIRTETGTENLDDLGPGVSVTIFRRFGDRGEVVWDAYPGENSGIQQNSAP